jgi:hypothetical protein
MMELPLGNVFIVGIAAGTVGYILWLVFEAVFDPYQFGSTLKGVAERIGIGLSTLAYGAITASALKVLVGSGRNGEEKQQLLASRVLAWPAGEWLVGAAGLVVVVAGLYQIKYVYDGDHKRRMQMDGWGKFATTLVNLLGWTGYCARCAILLVLGWFLVQAAWSSNPGAVGDTDTAFDFLGLSGGAFGNGVFSAVALGTISYGIFMYINAVYFKPHR